MSDLDRFRRDNAGAGVIQAYRAAIDDGIRPILTIVVPETGRVLVGLAELSRYRAVVDEAARAAS